ncbi:MAG: cytochrome b562 [Planctomycetota bacterium]
MNHDPIDRSTPMKRLPEYLLVSALTVAITLAIVPMGQPAVAQQDQEKDATEVIQYAMAVLGSNFRQVRRQQSKPDQNQASADLLAEMIVVSVESKPYLPKNATTDDLKLSYRELMNKMIIVFAKAENAALQGDNEKLKEYLREANEVRAEGHELFITEE